MTENRERVFGKKPPVSNDAIEDAFERVRRVRTVLDAPSVADAGVLLWTAYSLKNRIGMNVLPAWHDLPERERRVLELAYYVDALDDTAFERQVQIANENEKKLMAQMHELKGETAESLFRTLGLYCFDPSDLEDVEMSDILNWLQNRAPRDPAIWHEMPHLNWDYAEELYEILLWVVEQPECDAATAIEILHLMSPDTTMDKASGSMKWVFGATDFDPETSNEVKLLKTICLRSEGDGFEAPNLGSDSSQKQNLSLLDMMRQVLVDIESDGRHVPFPLPEKLLSMPIPENLPETDRPIIAHDDRIKLPKTPSGEVSG